MITKNIFVVADSEAAIIELSGVKALAEKVSMVVFGGEAMAKVAVSYGADVVYAYDKADGVMIEDYAGLVKDLAVEKEASAVIFSNASTGRLLAGKVAAKLGVAVAANVAVLTGEGETRKMVYGGACYRTEKLSVATPVITLASGAFEPVIENASCAGEVVAMSDVPESKVKLIERREKTETVVNLSASKYIVDIGRGLAAQEDLAMFEELADVMGADIGCSRPVAEALGWMPVSRYIGITGNIIKPDIVLMFGISGQVQHIIGVEESKTVVAINKDDKALCFEHSDFGVVGDMYKIVPKLIERLKN